MEIITKIIRADNKNKIIKLPKKFLGKDVKVTMEVLQRKKINNGSIDERIKRLNEFYKLARQKNIQIPKNMDIDKVMNEMNDAIL